MLKFILIILDGFGLRKQKEGNAIALANTPNLDKLFKEASTSSIETSGKYVGLPDKVMGNSEVGHMNIGAGRIVKQDLVRINEDINLDKLKNNKDLTNTFNYVNQNNSTLHLIGLLSDGSVHSHIDHFKYILKSAKKYNVESVSIHVFTDGRDTPPTSGVKYIKELSSYMEKAQLGTISSICGRYYAMDRDERWDRNKLAYNLLVDGKGDIFTSPIDIIEESYNDGISDEFIKPKFSNNGKVIEQKDAVLCMNFRADRMRQISRLFTDKTFDEFDTKALDIRYVSMTKYKSDFTFPSLYLPIKLDKIFPEILSENGYQQLRIAETEKYAHVTYFFNGGVEKKFKGEDRVLVPSPRVATYDLMPEMSAYKLTDKILIEMNSKKYDAIIINYANPDMVGHTGDLSAAIKAIEAVDNCIGKVIECSNKLKSALFLTADHGNLEMMIDPVSKDVHTAHTTSPVPLLMLAPYNNYDLISKGKLADIAPTILDYLNLDIPDEMDGNSLLLTK